MSFFGNLLWIFLGGGIFIFLEYFIGGLLLCLTIVGIPFGVQCIKLSILGFAPFGVKIVDYGRGSGLLALVMNIIWLFVGGFWIALTHLVLAFVLAITIIGLPFAKQHLKFASLALTPFGKELRR
ncbi:MAG TPA: YccF domain-containing protein [Balneolales bacterium]|nr:YccF domain-containing protein [Balneolales bacterium]